MQAALKGKSNEPFEKPGDVYQMDVDGLMMGKPHAGSPTRKEYFINNLVFQIRNPKSQIRNPNNFHDIYHTFLHLIP